MTKCSFRWRLSFNKILCKKIIWSLYINLQRMYICRHHAFSFSDYVIDFGFGHNLRLKACLCSIPSCHVKTYQNTEHTTHYSLMLTFFRHVPTWKWSVNFWSRAMHLISDQQWIERMLRIRISTLSILEYRSRELEIDPCYEPWVIWDA